METMVEYSADHETTRAAVAEVDSHLKVQLIDSAAEWQALAVDWDRLAPQPMLGHIWMSIWWRHMARPPADRLAILAVKRQADVIGFAPFYVTKTMFGRTIKFLGSGAASSDYLELLHAAGQAAAVSQAVAGWIMGKSCRDQFGRIDLVELEGHASDAAGISQLRQHLEAAGWIAESKALESSWAVSHSGDWEAYTRSLSASSRRRVRRAEKLQDEGLVQPRIWRNASEIAAVWPRFVAVHQARRHYKGQAGCFADPAFGGFLREVTLNLAAEGKAWLYGIEREQVPIAFALMLEGRQQLQVYQTGVDAEHLRLEPGHVTNALLMKYAIERGYETLDFLRGDEPYKAKWNALARPLERSRISCPHWSSQWRSHLIRWGRHLINGCRR